MLKRHLWLEIFKLENFINNFINVTIELNQMVMKQYHHLNIFFFKCHKLLTIATLVTVQRGSASNKSVLLFADVFTTYKHFPDKTVCL